MKKLLLFMLFLLAMPGVYAQYPVAVESALQKAGKNRVELEKAISYFKDTGDPYKIKAIHFLVTNMDIHYSDNYYWTDSTGKKLAFSELDYPDFAAAVAGFEALKLAHGKIKPVPFISRDIETIKADFLIENVETAFESWKDKRFTPENFTIFCEYVLPYRTSIEPLQPWRSEYRQKFASSFNLPTATEQKEYLLNFTEGMKDVEFSNSFSFEKRKEPLPRLGAQQLLLRKKGACEDIAAFRAFVLRSQGVPATVDIIPYWATASAGHFFTMAFTDQLKEVALDPMKEDSIRGQTFYREPSKVLATTFSRQKETLAFFTDTSQIPPGFMRMQNYKDITTRFWPTQQVQCNLHQNKTPIVYAAVFNYMHWRPTWWGKTVNNTVTFTEMPQGVVVLPMWYINHRMVPAGYPVIAYGGKQKELKPNLAERHSISLPWQNKYLVYRIGSKYTLYYWDNSWKRLEQKTAVQTDKMDFDNVPKNTLLLLRPDYSNGKERPFVITDTGERLWW